MGLVRDTWRWLTEPLEERSIDSFEDHPGLTEQLMAVQGLTPRPWRVASLREALGVPGIQRAVSLIANTTGSLSVRAYRDGMPMPEVPRIVARPDPYLTPREFYRDTAYYLATRGEAVWWIAARDSDGNPASLIVVPLAELTIEPNERDRRFPIYRWGNQRGFRYAPVASPNGAFVHITYLREPGQLRGVGPLQMCGAAVSVTVESQEWAANFFASGGIPSVHIKAAMKLSPEEAANLKEDWVSTPSNMPKVSDPTIDDVTAFEMSPQSAQLNEARLSNVGEAARMFGIPGSLLEFSVPGSSLTYTNVAEEYAKFIRTSLAINYLEPIEQALTDLLTRSTVARFDVQGLLRADVKTRWEVYEKAVAVLGPDEGAQYARSHEGLAPGDPELQPVPPAQPASIPTRIPERR